MEPTLQTPRHHGSGPLREALTAADSPVARSVARMDLHIGARRGTAPHRTYGRRRRRQDRRDRYRASREAGLS